MSIGGKKFKIDYFTGVPEISLNVFIGSPDPKFKKSKLIRRALIDTGADFTCIPHELVKEIHVIPTGRFVEIRGYNNEYETFDIYSAKVVIDSIINEIVEIILWDYDPIIGNNLLLKWHTLINGPDGTFEIANSDTGGN